MYAYINKHKISSIILAVIMCAVLLLGVEAIRYYQFEQYCEEVRIRNYCPTNIGVECARASGEECNSFQLF